MYESTSTHESTLHLPLQAEPISRTPGESAALASQAGVSASFDWGSFLQQALPVATSVLGSLL